MNVTKIKIKNLFGIKEYETDGSSLELSGKNGVGKSSVIDAIRYALTNKSSREYIVRQGETEGEILVETDTGLVIDRKARTQMADYKSVKQNGLEVRSIFKRYLYISAVESGRVHEHGFQAAECTDFRHDRVSVEYGHNQRMVRRNSIMG